MKLRSKVSILVLLLWVVALAAISLSSLYIRASYLRIEQEQATNNGLRVVSALDETVRAVQTVTTDWSVWDESYRFIKDHNKQFIAVNLVPGSFTAANVDVMLFFDVTGKLVQAASLNAQTGMMTGTSTALLRYMQGSPFIQVPKVDSAIRGIVSLPSGLLLAASHAIVTSNKTGPVRGALVMGRFLTQENIDNIRRITKVNVSFVMLNEVEHNANLKAIYNRLLETDSVMQAVDNRTMMLYRLLFDIEKKPVALLKITMPRTIYLAGIGTIRYYNMIFIAYSILFSALLWSLLHVLIVKRIEQFSTQFHVSPENEAMLIKVMNQSTDEIALASSLYHQAMHDPLTGLANRNLLYEIFNRATSDKHSEEYKIAVLFFDIDHFKRVNDTLGHGVGDSLLICMAKRLQVGLRKGDVAARLGGDEFVVLLTNVHQSQLKAVVERVYQQLADPVNIQGHELLLLSSLGISVYPDDGESIDGLIKKADTALYYAKEKGRHRYQFYSHELQKILRDAHKQEVALQRALDKHEFLVYYQPIFDLKTGQILSLEALLRWRHPEKGVISAGDIIPVAEKTGLIEEIGGWVLQTVCAQLAAWVKKGVPIVPVAVNISSMQAKRISISKQISDILRQTNISPHYLELELTETGFIEITPIILKELYLLKEMGVQLSVDDFGTGYSGLRYLKSLPVNKIKIDQSFIKDIMTNADDRAITLAIIDIAHQLKLVVIAEGVETLEQLNFLREHQVDAVQGYFLSSPLDAEHCEKMLFIKQMPVTLLPLD